MVAVDADPLRQPGTAVAGLYDDVTVEILSRVPVKDLRRSECVSKPWRDLIADPLHRKKLPQTLEGFFYGGADGRRTYGHFTSLSGRGESAPPVDPSFSFLTSKLAGIQNMLLLDSCNGLLLFWCTREGKFGYIVCNPATEELVTVPASSGSCPPPPLPPLEESYLNVDDRERYSHTFLMFDPAVSSRFHLLQFWATRMMVELETVYSYSSETRAWTDMSIKWKRGEGGGEWLPRRDDVIGFRCGRALVSGLLHLIVFEDQEEGEEEVNQIVAVDGEGKICRIIKHVPAATAFIGQSQGHLHCISKNWELLEDLYFQFTGLSVWVLEDDTQEWILKHNVSSSQLFGSLSCPALYDIVAIHPEHNLVILVQQWKEKLVSYDMNSMELRALCTLGEGYRFITPYVPRFMESPVFATKD